MKVLIGNLKEQAEAVDAERVALVDELERLGRELDRLTGGAETPPADDVDRLRREMATLKARGDDYQQKKRSTEDELAELEKLAEETREAYKAADVEGEKLYFEIYKLTATLAVGVLVAVSAITAGLISNPGAVWMLALAYILLLTCITGSVGACLATALRIRTGLSPDRMANRGESESRIDKFFGGSYFFWMSVGGLSIGVTLASLFLSFNYDEMSRTSESSPQITENGTRSPNSVEGSYSPNSVE